MPQPRVEDIRQKLDKVDPVKLLVEITKEEAIVLRDIIDRLDACRRHSTIA